MVEGQATAEALVTSQQISFLGQVDPESGRISDSTHELYGQNISGKILVFPHSVGSSVGAYIIYWLKKTGKSPAAFINENSDSVTVSGCAVAGIPLVDRPEGGIHQIRPGRVVKVDGKLSIITIE